MSESRPLLVATLAAQSVESARNELAELGTETADVAEIRFDRWPSDSLLDAAQVFPAPLPVLATYRSRAEGGSGSDDPDARAEILGRLANSGAAYIDVEAHRDRRAAQAIRGTQPSVQLVVSQHFLSEPPTDRWVAALEPPTAGTAFSKVVFPCGVQALARNVLPNLPSPDFPYVLHTTGTSGPLLRAWGKRLGQAAVYSGPPSFSGRSPVEPSQLPVDRLRRFFDAPGHPPLFAVVGHPVAHSRSPDLHSAWMARDAHAGLYIALDIAGEADFVELLPVLGTRGFRGLNITHPLKSAAFASSTEASARAEACACANVLTFEEGEILADNTDVIAISRRLSELRAEGWAGDRVSVVGTGGAARATLAAARDLGVPSEVLGRDPRAAAAIASEFGARVRGEESAIPSLLVNATPAGHPESGELAVPISSALGRSTRVLDWVYGPTGPGLRELAMASGAAYEDGRRLLVYQAAASYDLWWGNPPDEGAVRSLLESP